MESFKGLRLRTIFSNTSSQFGVKVITSFTALLTTLLISYFLGLDVYGSFTKITTVVLLSYLFVDFGINTIFIKEHFHAVKKQFGNLLGLRLFLSLLVLAGIIFLTVLLPFDPATLAGFSPQEKAGILIFALTLIPYALNISLNAFLQKELKYSLSLFPNFLSSIILLLVILCAVYLNSFYFLFAAFIISGFILFFSLYSSIKKRFSVSLDLHAISTFSTNILKQSFPLASILILNVMYFKIDVLILSAYFPNQEVGVYGLSYKFFEFLIAIPAFLSNSIYPILLEKMGNREAFITHFKQYLKIFFACGMVVALITVLAAPLLGVMKYEFNPSILPLQILALSLPFFFFTSILQWVLIIKNHMRALIGIYLVSMAINIALNFVFIPQYGYMAAAVITGISEAIVFLSMVLYVLAKKRTLFKS